MTFLISHFYEGGTQAQYDAVVGTVPPEGGLPPGQICHAAGPAEGGYLIVATWDSKASFDTFLTGTLLPALGGIEGGFGGPPQEHSCEVARLVTA